MNDSLRSCMKAPITVSQKLFIKSHYSNEKDDFLDELISLWEEPISKYINKKVYTVEKKIYGELDGMTKSASKFKTHEILDIMLNAYSVQDFMIIINFTMRNRMKIEKKLGPRKLNKEEYKGLKLIISEWKNHVNNPKTHDSLQELISKHQFRKKLEKSLSNTSKSSLNIRKLVDDYCKTYLIVAKIQQVRRLRKGSSKNPGNISLSDNILEDAWKLFDSIGNNKDKIEPHSIIPTKNLDFLILMQHHLNNNRRYNSRTPSFSSPLSNLDDFGTKIEEIMDSRDNKPVWSEIYYWWFLRMKSKFFKVRLDTINKSKIDKMILKHKKSLTPQKRGYIEEIEKQEADNLVVVGDNKLIDGFNEISKYLIKELESSGNPLTTSGSQNKNLSRTERKSLSETDKEARKTSNMIIRDLMGILMSDGEIIPKNLTNPFIITSTTQPICLEYDSNEEKFIVLNLVPRDKSSLINNCRNAIRNANFSLRFLKPRNNFKSLILQIITLIQLIIKLRVNLQDSRIYRYRFPKYTKRNVWSDNRNILEKELFDELSEGLISIMENIQGQLKRDDSMYELLDYWIKQIDQIPPKLCIPNSMNLSHNIGRLGMLCDVLSSFLGLIDISGTEQVKGKIILYKMENIHTTSSTDSSTAKSKQYKPNKKSFIEITTEDLNLKPVGETLVD